MTLSEKFYMVKINYTDGNVDFIGKKGDEFVIADDYGTKVIFDNCEEAKEAMKWFREHGDYEGVENVELLVND